MDIAKIKEEERLAFEGLGKNLGIINNIVKDARNIHKQIREATIAAVIFYERLRVAREARERVPSGPPSGSSAGKRLASSSPESSTPQNKRVKTKQITARNQNQTSVNKTPNEASEGKETVNLEWKTVDHRKKKKKKEEEKVSTGLQQAGPIKRSTRGRRSEAVAVKPKDASCSYAEMLKAIKAKVDPDALGVKVTKIRQTRNGEVLFEIAKGGKADELKIAVAQALGDDASVRNMDQKSVAVEIRDIDGATEEKEVVNAIKALAPASDTQIVKVRALRKTFGETQMAVITMPAAMADVVLKAGKVKIGWIMCRVRERKRTLQCYRCLSFGHLAKECSGPDRSKLCRLCGKDGHFAKECKEEPYCAVCADEGKPGGAQHILSRARCESRRRETHLGRGREAQDLFLQEARERRSDILVVSEHYRMPESGQWFQDTTARAAIAIENSKLNIREVDDTAANFVWVDVGGVRAYSVYLSPNDAFEDFQRDLDNLEQSIRSASGEVLVAGDLNCKSPEWGSKKLDARGEVLSEMVARLDLVILNEGTVPTFRRGNKTSRVDVTFGSAGVAARTTGWCVSEDESLSDHQYIEYTLENRTRETSKATVENRGWVTRKIDNVKLREYLETAKRQRGLAQTQPNPDPEALVEFAVTTITAACNQAMPRRRSHPNRKKPVYWWNTDIAEKRKKCLAARRKMQRGRNTPDEATLSEQYKEARKELRMEIKKSKRKCWTDLCRTVEEDPWGLPYRIVTKKMMGRREIPGIKNPKRVGNIVTNLFPRHERRPGRPTSTRDVQIDPFTVEELQEAAKRLKCGKAPGPDYIPNEVLKEVVEVWPELLLEVYNTCLREGIFPKRWKRQNLVLFRKGEKPLDEPSSYRPICLLDTLGKLFERLILQRMERYITLSPMQFGFRRGRSTIDAIQEVVSAANRIKKVPWSSKGYCALVTLDIRNAFNTARWDMVMKALERKKTPDYLQQIIDNYLMDRILLYDTEKGHMEYEVTAGVPQGSILGPFLWNVMYDGLLELTLPEGSLAIGFADDIALVTTARSTSIIELVTNESMRRASGWFRENGLELALQKTEAVLITDKRLFTSPTLSLEGEVVDWKRSVKYLGVHLDAGLRYAEQAKLATERAASTAVALTRLMPNVGGPREEKRRLLNSVIHSKILYGAEIWGEAIERGDVRRKMASMQRRSVQRVISAYRTVSISAALVLASTPPIDLLIRERREIYLEYKRENDSQRKRGIKKAARERLFERWQERWDADTKGRWTYTLIPNLTVWCKRGHGRMDYHLTQALTGHGCFNEYLTKIGKRECAACLYCGHTPDSALHTIFQCSAMENERVELERQLEGCINENNLISYMMEDEESWLAVARYLTVTIRMKEEMEHAEKNNRRGNSP